MTDATTVTKALWKDTTIAESDAIVLVERFPYFPLASVGEDRIRESTEMRPTYCHWKGIATYYDVLVDGEVNVGAGWVYKQPYAEAEVITDHIAFWKEVKIVNKPERESLFDTGGPIGKRTGWEALCWLLVSTKDDTELTMADITERAALSEEELTTAWAHADVQRYAGRYKWSLNAGASPRLSKSG